MYFLTAKEVVLIAEHVPCSADCEAHSAERHEGPGRVDEESAALIGGGFWIVIGPPGKSAEDKII